MAFYNRINDFYTLVGNNVASKADESIDGFLNSLTDKYSNAGLILNYIKNKGVSGNTTIGRLLSTPQYFNLISEALKLARLTDKTDFYQKTVEDNSLYTQENKLSLLPNDVDPYSGDTLSFTTLVEVKESGLIKDFPTVGIDATGKSYRLVGQVVLSTPNEFFYVIPLGLLTVNSPANYQFAFGPSRNNVQAIETSTSPFAPWNTSTPLGANCLVTDANTGYSTPADIAYLYADNNNPGLTDDDYELFLVVASLSTDINSTIVTIDQEITIGVTTDDLNDVNITFTNV